MISDNAGEPLWFAMSATFGRSMKAKEFLEGKQVRCFVPMKYAMVNDRRQGKVRRLVPAINNLIFVHTTKERIQALKTGMKYLQYLTKQEGSRNVPIIVPERQMQQFITVCDTYSSDLVYLSPEEVNLSKGTPVRIIGGAFDGIEGLFVKVDGKRRKRVAVMVQGIAAVMITEFTEGYLQVLDNQ